MPGSRFLTSSDRKFRYLLALKLHKTVEEMECGMPFDEYITWHTALAWKAKEDQRAAKKASGRRRQIR